MPIVDVKMWKGVSDAAVEQIISGITKVFVELGNPERAVEVIVHEIPKTHWGVGGKTRIKSDGRREAPLESSHPIDRSFQFAAQTPMCFKVCPLLIFILHVCILVAFNVRISNFSV